MAVKEESPHNATDELIRHSPRKYYRASIITSHWQLRSLISSPKQHIIYYPSGVEIIRLDTKTREREVAATLSFSPRCLVASKDWVCCGGEHGNYTSIYIGDRELGRDLSSSRMDLDADARLPLVLEPTGLSLPRDSSTLSRGSSPSATTHIRKIGTEIVNCITLWYPSEISAPSTYQNPVAVVALNDCTISILNLHDSKTLDNLTLPDFVNRAVMSPNGELLVAICDDPFLYIHKRQEKQSAKSRFESKQIAEYEWVAAGRVQLEGQRQADASIMRGSFAACFSSSGKYLAVATQYGMISVFLTSSLLKQDHDPLVVSFTTSRPGNEHGAARAMEFSPDPFDLLAWTESSGRVGVADVRDLFLSRQLINIDSHGPTVERVWITERLDDPPAVDPRLRSFRTESASPAPDYLGLDFDRHELISLTRDLTDRHHSPLTPEEMEVLQAHRIARNQRDAARDARLLAQAQAYRNSRNAPWDTQRSSGTSVTPRDGSSAAESRVSTAGLPGVLREFVNSDRNPASFRAFIDRQNQDRERRSQHEPRRRISSILVASENGLEREPSGSGRTSADTYTSLERLSLAPRLPHIGTESPNTQWGELESLYRARLTAEPPATRLRIEDYDESQGLAQRLRPPWRSLEEINAFNMELINPDGTRRERRAGTIETMGCTWSEDGRILYVGAGDGIYEYHVNVSGRKMVPSIVLR